MPRSDDTTELLIVLPPDVPARPKAKEMIDPMVLTRAYRHGLRAQPQFIAWTFGDAEAELRAGWLLNGETARWNDVRDAVQRGFEAEDE